jgi:putative spermidine/putrescine transport system ATP-binding protein
MASEPHLSVRKLRRRFDTVVALRDVSLDVERGEFLTLLGPSGSGKTTFLNLIAGFDPPEGGSIHLDGREITDHAPYERDLGMVFQNYALFPHLTVAENVAFPLRMRGRVPEAELQARVREALALVQLETFEERFPAELSGGQSQRVAIARAIVHRPALLLMDEPLGALDRKLRTEMQFEIKRLHRKLGATILYVTHDQEEALTMSDRVAVLSRGELEQCAPPQMLYDQPRTQFVAGFVGESNFLPGEIMVVDGRTTANTPAAELTVPLASGNWRAGQRVVIAFRPEHVKVHAAGNGGGREHRFRATVQELNFLGDAVKYKLDFHGTTILAKFPVDAMDAFMTIGQAVALSVQPSKCRVFAEGAEPIAAGGGSS